MDNPNLKPMVFIEKTKKTIKKLNRKRPLTYTDILFFILSLLCGRATLLSSMRPFGGAFFAASFSKKRGYLYLLGATLGQIWSGAPFYQVGKYIFAMTVFSLIYDRFPQNNPYKEVLRGSIFSISLALAGGFFTFASKTSFTTYYDVMLLLVECVVSFGATCAFAHGIPVIKKLKLSYSFSSLEEISLVALLGCALWGGKDISNFFIFNLSDIIGLLVVIVFAVRLGSGKGVIAGLTMGLVSALGSGRVDISCVSYAFSALGASLLGRFGAIPACSGFLLANALITALANGSTEVLINIYDIFAACFLYSIIPEKALLYLTNFGSRDEKDRIATDERAYSSYVLYNAENTVKRLSARMERLEEKRLVKNEAELRFFERLTRRSCHGCGMRRLCWNRDVQKTTSTIRGALYDYKDTGKLNWEKLPENCLRPKELRDSFLQMAEIYRCDLIWQGKLREVKNSANMQMFAFFEILKAARTALGEEQSFDRALADDITRKLTDENINCENVVVMRDKDMDPTVLLTLSPCGGFSMCEKGAAEVISTACGQEMILAGKKDCKNCNLRYVTAPINKVSFAFSKENRNKKKPSGDSVITRVINKNLYAAVLTDGMGYGEKALWESRSSGEMLLDLIEAGVEGEKAMEIVNALLIPSGEATFAATDLCLFDTKEQTAKIIKCGGAVSFSKSGDRVDALYSKTMPLGAGMKKDVESYTLSTREGDIIVMISDGVLESAREGLKDGWIIKELEGFTGDDVGRLADLIVERAMEKCHKTPMDDITVLTAYIR